MALYNVSIHGATESPTLEFITCFSNAKSQALHLELLSAPPASVGKRGIMIFHGLSSFVWKADQLKHFPRTQPLILLEPSDKHPALVV